MPDVPTTPAASIDAFSAGELARIRRKIDSMTGPGITNGPDFIHITTPTPPKASLMASTGGGGSCNCQFQGMVCGAVTNNTSGCFFPMFVSSIELT